MTFLEERERAVLSELARDGPARVAFQGLRRRLDLHQQALTRTLARLAAAGYVAREDEGYRLTDAGLAALGATPATFAAAREQQTVVHAILPPGLGPEEVAEQLSRRWFRGLRWYSRADTPDGTTLTWLTEPGNATVRVRVRGDAFTLESDARAGEARQATIATRGVLAALAEMYGFGNESDAGGPLAAFARSDSFAA
ncbi:MAG: MarR family transcriptional regulator [Thermoplasmatota archaeon]